jgi:hypothetical protein
MTKNYENMNRVERITHTLTRTDFPVGAPAKEDGLVHRSGRSGVVAKVHAICDDYSAKGKSRADILARCVKLGIAYHTARTQYDRWRNPPKAKQAKAKKSK